MSDDHVPDPLPHESRRSDDLGRVVQYAAGGLLAAFLVCLGGVTGGSGGVASVLVIGGGFAAFSWWLHRLLARS